MIVESADERKLFVKIPEQCSPSVYRLKYLVQGVWKFSENRIDFICSQNFSDNRDSLLISEALTKTTVENEIHGGWRLITKAGDKHIYRPNENHSSSFEMTAFTAGDGHRVFVRYQIPIEKSQYLRISRRLDDSFELTYNMQKSAVDLAQIIEIDQHVVTYAKSITHRVN